MQSKQVGPGLNSWRLRFNEGSSASSQPLTKQPTSARSTTRAAVRLTDFTTTLADKGQSTIRLASQLEPIDDPFDDPFGDASPPPEPLSVPSQPAPVFEMPTATTAAQPSDLPDSLREPSDSAPLPPLQPGRAATTSNCDRIYNQRDCCAADTACKTARDYLRSSSIRDISIDITPKQTVAKLSSEGTDHYDRERRLTLAEAPSRLWKNTEGQVVADGHLADFREGRVIVRQGDGTTVPIPFANLSEDDTCFLTAWWSIPSECTMGNEEFAGRSWVPTTMTWKASALCHKPLYFEEVQLERYGHTAGPLVQPVVSSAHFFLNVATLPYKMGINPPNECRYSLGYYRPGDCAPWLVPPVPLSVRGALAQAAVIVGGVAVIP